MDIFRKMFKKKNEVPQNLGAGAEKSSKPQVERRKHRRHMVCELSYLYPSGKPPIQVNVIDVSIGGVKIETKEIIKMGSKLGLGLYTGGIVVNILINAIWESKSSTKYVYGAEFCDTDPKAIAYIRKYVSEKSFGS